MPYFELDETRHLLHVHIPKTGGTSINNYFWETYPTAKSRLYGRIGRYPTVLQHLTLEQILNDEAYFGVRSSDCDVLAVVRDPYSRMLSELAYSRMIDDSIRSNDSIRERTFRALQSLLADFSMNPYVHGGRLRPQSDYVKVPERFRESFRESDRIKILRTETLQGDMRALGFVDFSKRDNATGAHRVDPFEYFDDRSVALINSVYRADFDAFGYGMK